jgi:hypothetical protein
MDDDDEKISLDNFQALTAKEKAAVWRGRLYQTHKAHGTLGIYYHMYPDERPRGREHDRDHDDDGLGR